MYEMDEQIAPHEERKELDGDFKCRVARWEKEGGFDYRAKAP